MIKLTLYVKSGDNFGAQVESQRSTIAEVKKELNENRFLEILDRESLDDNTYRLVKSLVNRNEIEQITEGWHNE